MESVCARLSEDDIAKKSCVEKMTKLRSENTTTYACIVACARGPLDRATRTACERKCYMRDVSVEKMLGEIERQSKNNFQMESDRSGEGLGPFVHVFCPASPKVPAEIPWIDAPSTVPAETWQHPSWKCLKFSPSGPLQFQFEYRTNDKEAEWARFQAIARTRLPSGRIYVATLRGVGTRTGDAIRESFDETIE